jgi:hypothetical protein
MAYRQNAEGEGIRRTFAQGLPAADGPITLIWWSYTDSIRASWTSYMSLGPTTFTGTDYFIAAGETASHLWSLGVEGTDTNGPAIQTGQWYAQAFRREITGGDYQQKFWYALPTEASVITVDSGSLTFDLDLGSTHELSFGRNPWALGEWTDGRFAGIKVFEASLTFAQIVAEAERPELVNGGLTPWAIVPCPTASDLTDISGNGRHFTSVAGGLTDAADPPYTPVGGSPVAVAQHSYRQRRL